MSNNSDSFIIVDINDELLIPKLFFNTLSRFGFVSSIERLLEHKMVADEYNGCSFPTDADADETPFEGVKFRYIDDEIIVDESLFIELIIKACEGFLKHNPDKLKEIKLLLSKINQNP